MDKKILGLSAALFVSAFGLAPATQAIEPMHDIIITQADVDKALAEDKELSADTKLKTEDKMKIAAKHACMNKVTGTSQATHKASAEMTEVTATPVQNGWRCVTGTEHLEKVQKGKRS